MFQLYILIYLFMITTILKNTNQASKLNSLSLKIKEYRTYILQASTQHVLYLLQNIEDQMIEIKEYAEIVNRQMDKIQQQILMKVLGLGYKQSNQKDKFMLYLWQIFNYLFINTEHLPSFMIDAIHPLIEFNIKYQLFYSENSIKNAQILIHNIITKLLKNKDHYFYYENHIIHWLQILLTYFYEGSSNKYNLLFKYSKKQQTLLGQFQWLSYIFTQLFSEKYFNMAEQSSLVQKIIQSSFHPQKITYNLLHTIGDYFQQIIDKRITTQLIYKYQSHIQDIKEMYRSKQQILGGSIKITQLDLRYICKILKKHLLKHRQIITQYVHSKIQKKLNIIIVQQFRINEEIIQQIYHLLNCVLFIGGYNQKVQNIIMYDVLGQDKLLLNYLQVSYIIYKNIQSSKIKNKVNLLVQMQQQMKKKLFDVVAYKQGSIECIDIKQLQLQKILAKGQLVNILRLFTNLVHINKKAIRPFQEQPKYLHIILSLTHDSISQATMRQWAIMFIRNVSQWSQIMRQQIGKIKIEMKVD